MTEGAQIAIVVLIAVLVGAALPVLYQLQRVLRSARTILTNADQRLERALAEVTNAAGRVDQVVARAEQDLEGLRPHIEAAANLGRMALRLQGMIRPIATLGGAVGPAMVAAVRAIFAPPAGAAGDRNESVRAEPEAAAPYRPRSLQPDLAQFQPKEVAHHHE